MAHDLTPSPLSRKETGSQSRHTALVHVLQHWQRGLSCYL
jgi:hypothetical protein